MNIALALLLPLAAAHTTAQAEECRDFYRFTWKVDRDKHTLKRLHRDKKAHSLCEAAPTSGIENARIELRDPKGAVAYEAPIHLSDSLFHDEDAGKGLLRGGVRDERDPILVSRLPLAPAANEHLWKLRVLPLDGDTPIAEGKP